LCADGLRPNVTVTSTQRFEVTLTVDRQGTSLNNKQGLHKVTRRPTINLGSV
jgi:hypothetical protein